MKNRIVPLIMSVIQLLIGILAVAAFAVIAASGQEYTKFIPALLLGLGLIVLGILGIRLYFSKA